MVRPQAGTGLAITYAEQARPPAGLVGRSTLRRTGRDDEHRGMTNIPTIDRTAQADVQSCERGSRIEFTGSRITR